MAFDRDTTLRKAEKLLRQGRIDAAMAEYRAVIDDQPSDWNTINVLGDLYVRAGQIDKAATEYTRIADHLAKEGFLPKAGAVYKKILKIKPDDEHALLQMGEISARQGLLADAKASLSGLAAKRQARGDRRGAAEVRVRLGSLDPGDFEARLTGARASVEIGDPAAAVKQLKELSADLQERGREDEALQLLREAAQLDPTDAESRGRLLHAYMARGDLAAAREYATTAAQFKDVANDLLRQGREEEGLAALVEAANLDPADTEARARLARAYITRGDLTRARTYLTREVAGTDGDLLWTLAEMDLREGQIDQGTALLQEMLAGDPSRRDHLVILGCSIAEANVDAGFHCIELAANAAIADDEWAAAAAALNEFVSRVPDHIPALMRLVEICVDGGLEATMYSAQALLADAYLVAGRGAEARVIAEDLVAREPWERANMERFRRALTLLGETDIDAVIAERLSGQSPFTSTDFFGAVSDDQSATIPASAPVEEPRQAPEKPEASLPPAPSQEPKAPAVEKPVEKPVEKAVEKAVEKPRARAKAQPRTPAEDEAFELGPNAIDLAAILDGTRAVGGPAPAAAPPQESSEIDLSSVLEELKTGKPASSATPADRRQPGQTADIEGVFKGLRDEATHQTTTEMAAQHYKLATTYKEMGMIDEAVKALEVAARSPRHRFDAAGMLARIYLERSLPEKAIEWFEQAAEASAPNPDAGHALLYELATALEAQGESSRALAIFLELRADAGDYRDLAARLERLSKVQMRG